MSVVPQATKPVSTEVKQRAVAIGILGEISGPQLPKLSSRRTTES